MGQSPAKRIQGLLFVTGQPGAVVAMRTGNVSQGSNTVMMFTVEIMCTGPQQSVRLGEFFVDGCRECALLYALNKRSSIWRGNMTINLLPLSGPFAGSDGQMGFLP